MAPKPPKQSRAIQTRQNLMAALERLLRKHEFETISVQDIAKEAGVAVGSVYSHFKDKTAFLEALLIYWRDQVEAQLEIAETQDTKAAFVALGSLRAALSEATKAVHAQIVENGHILRALQTYARLHPDAEDEDWQTLVVRSFAPIGELLEVFSDEITLQDQDLATRMLGVFFNTIFIRTALMPQDTLLDVARLDAETMIQEVTDMAFGYLTLAR
ncbi:MAG: TetR/AcrR family transcriptional regulator [Pseudomonadota bacterium]